MRKGLVIVGVVLLVIGLLLTLAGFLPGMAAVKASDIEYSVEEGFADYDEGDEVLITGEITEKAGTSGMYTYMLDDELPVLAGEDIGSEGDTVTLNCEVISFLGVEVMEAKSIINPINPLNIIGIILLIVGIIVMILGIKKGAKTAEVQPMQPGVMPPVQPGMQQPMQQPPAQAGMRTYNCPHCQGAFTSQIPQMATLVNCPTCGGQVTISP